MLRILPYIKCKIVAFFDLMKKNELKEKEDEKQEEERKEERKKYISPVYLRAISKQDKPVKQSEVRMSVK